MSNWFSRILPGRGSPLALDAEAITVLQRWVALPEPDLGRAHFETRYVVVNTEASGLDLDKDRLLAVAAIVVDGGLITARESYYAALEPSPASSLAGLLELAGKGPAVMFNAPFNRGMLERALADHLGIELQISCLDLYWVLPALFPEKLEKPARLADWMAAFEIETFQRHHALGDAWAIAQLFLAAQARALAQGTTSVRALAELERTYRQYWRKV